MAKIHPQAPLSSSSLGYFTSKQETFTIWMKSLIVNGHGCTVFDSNGQIVYRVDNYDSRCRAKVHLMDLRGQILFTILRKVTPYSIMILILVLIISVNTYIYI